MNTNKPSRLARTALVSALALALLASPALAGAADDIFGSTSPLKKLTDFITGPLAFMIVIVGIVVTGGMLIFGNDLSGFGRRAMLIVLGGGLVLGAVQVVSTLFASAAGASYSVERPLFKAPRAENAVQDLPLHGDQTQNPARANTSQD